MKNASPKGVLWDAEQVAAYLGVTENAAKNLMRSKIKAVNIAGVDKLRTTQIFCDEFVRQQFKGVK